MSKVKIVLMSDTHDRVCEVPDGDVLIHAGDLTMNGHPKNLRKVADWIRSQPHEHKIVIAGNHDAFLENAPNHAKYFLGPGITYLENEGCEVMGLRIWGSPITPTFYNWAFMADRGAPIRYYWDQIPADLDVLITHGPPRGILDQAVPYSNSEHCGCDDLLKAVRTKKPRVHVFGHIHGGRGSYHLDDTSFYNASIVNEDYEPVHKPWILTLETE